MSDSSGFLSEAQDLIETFARLLFELEAQLRDGEEPDPKRVDAAFRAVHTLKSLAGLAGLEALYGFSHELEFTLEEIRLGKLGLALEPLDALFEATGVFDELLRAGDDSERTAAVNTDAVLARLEALRRPPEHDGDGPDPLTWLDPDIRGALTEFQEHRLRENVRRGRALYSVQVDFDLMEFGDRFDTVEATLREHGELITKIPSPVDVAPDRIVFAFILGSEAALAVVAASIAGEGGVVEILRAAPAPEPPAPSSAESLEGEAEADDAVDSSDRGSETVRVDLRRLDVLMNLVGELSLVEANLGAYLERVRRDARDASSRELQTQLRTMSRRLGQLQQGILDVRMVPLGQTFDRVKRLVRRTSRDLEREVRLVVRGAGTELDKKIGEKLSKPLVHMVNNAIEHGIEPPDERERLGKPRAGRVELSAYQKGNRVVIELRDDGRGIDWRSLREKAVAKGFITPAEAAELDPARTINLIFLPGFSSKATASRTSGRGVGMDVVKTEIAELSGMIEVASEPGKGSRFRVTLPSTLAIIQALVIEAAGQTFCIQLNSVLESLMVQVDDIRTIEGHEVVSVRGRTLPLIHLARAFELGDQVGNKARARAQTYGRLYVVVVGLAEHRVGLVVDELLGQQDVVIKPLGPALAQVPGIAGATELGDNRTVLLLDVGTLVGEAVGGLDAQVAGIGSKAGDGIRVSTTLDS